MKKIDFQKEIHLPKPRLPKFGRKKPAEGAPEPSAASPAEEPQAVAESRGSRLAALKNKQVKLPKPKLNRKRSAAGATAAAPRPARKMPKGPEIKAPRVVDNVYRDLVDRRLLLPAIALIVAIIAVPLLLGGGGEPEVPAAAPVVDPDASAAISPAVLAESNSVRNYRERLEQLKQSNPFEQKFTSVPKSSGVAPEGDESQTGSTTGTGTTATGEPVAGTTPAPTSDPGSTGSSVAVPTGGETSTSTTTTETTETTESNGSETTTEETRVVEETRLITRRIEVKVGERGDVKTRENVKELTLLPSRQQPVVVFLGVSENAKRATFAVSADVSSTSGKGICEGGGPLGCEFLTLSIGDEQSFRYGNQGRDFRLKLLGIQDVEVKP